MPARYNAEEILEIACQIERNGAAFYRAAAELVSLTDSAALLLDLARMEDGHERAFTRMKAESTPVGENPSDPDGMAVTYLRAIAANHVFAATVSPAAHFTPDTSAAQVLQIALQAEFAAIAFFQGLLDFMPASFGPEKLKAIIREEQEHVVLLSGRLQALSQTGNA